MPIGVFEGPQGGQVYGSPFISRIDHTAPVRLDPSNLFGSDWLDERGWLKPGTPFKRDGTLVTGAGQQAYGMLVEATEILKLPRGGAVTQVGLDALGNRQMIVAVICEFNQDLLEDIVGRALNADEIAAIDAARTLVRV